MGDPKRHRKKYVTPKHPWRKELLEEQTKLVGMYGLRNKRELWRTENILRKYRAIARSLYGMFGDQRRKLEEQLLTKLYRLGILEEGATLEDVLRLNVEDFLRRRLQTMVYNLGLARSLYHARQLIVHGHVYVGDKVVRQPSYHVMRGEEGKIRLAIGQEVTGSK